MSQEYDHRFNESLEIDSLCDKVQKLNAHMRRDEGVGNEEMGVDFIEFYSNKINEIHNQFNTIKGKIQNKYNLPK